MTFQEYWTGLSPEAKRNMMIRTGLAMSVLSGISTGKRIPGAKTARTLLQERGITREMLRQMNPELL
jgi:hypothetical protein